MLKAVVGVTVMMWVRWTLPRLRIDQVITTCLKYCVPLASVCFIGAVGWQVLDLPSPSDWHLGTGPAYKVHEEWATHTNNSAASGADDRGAETTEQYQRESDQLLPPEPDDADKPLTGSSESPRSLAATPLGQELSP